MRQERIHERVYRVAGPDMTDPRDSAVYLIDLGEPVLIDCGSGFAFEKILKNIERLGFDPALIKNIVLTHCHVDHMGGAHLFKSHLGSRLIMHELDAVIAEQADQRLTAAFCFNIDFKPLHVDTKLKGDEGFLIFGLNRLAWLLTPGHTPGSISLYADIDRKRILFAQDIGAALLKEFDCDPVSWLRSVRKLEALDADILCDGHSGAYGPKRTVKRYLELCVKSQAEQGYIELT